MRTKTSIWKRRLCKVDAYVKSGDWRGLKRELIQYLVWKRVLPARTVEQITNSSQPDEIPLVWADPGVPLERISPFQWNEQFKNFLVFEGRVFREGFPIAAYDPHFLALDADPQVWKELEERKGRAEKATNRGLAVVFKVEDATELQLGSESVDKVIAISSVEHMFSQKGPGDVLAVKHIARILKPGGQAVITLPMSGEGPFHESPSGDEHFGGPYRLYTTEAVEERILSCSGMEKVTLKYLAYTTPDPRYLSTQFICFWRSLSQKEREKWAWAYALLSSMFNPILSEGEASKSAETLNTALICLRKIA